MRETPRQRRRGVREGLQAVYRARPRASRVVKETRSRLLSTKG
jgi:hypothetical protein